jgi:hypothetical protein
VAGFEFGITTTDAEAMCEQSGFEWRERERRDYYGCSGTPRAVGLEATTLVRFRGTQLCWVRVSGRPKALGPSAWTESFVALANALERKYGKPTKRDIRIPRSCHEDLRTCLQDGTARAELRWEVEARSVTLTADSVNEAPEIRLIYEAMRDLPPGPESENL